MQSAKSVRDQKNIHKKNLREVSSSHHFLKILHPLGQEAKKIFKKYSIPHHITASPHLHIHPPTSHIPHPFIKQFSKKICVICEIREKKNKNPAINKNIKENNLRKSANKISENQREKNKLPHPTPLKIRKMH